VAVAIIGASAAVPSAARAAAHAAPAPNAIPSGVRAGLALKHPGQRAHANAQFPLTLGSSDAHGAVAHNPQVYLVFWGSQWSSDPANAATTLTQFFQGLYGADDTWATVMDQYCSGVPIATVNCGINGSHVVHPESSPLVNTWFDNASAAPGAATYSQLANESIAAAQHFGNTTAASNYETQYVIASPTHTDPDNYLQSDFCAWHSSTTSPDGTIAFTNLPYLPDLNPTYCVADPNATSLDAYTVVESHEYAESVTDLWPLAGWADNQQPSEETADKCQYLDANLALSTGTFEVQGLWSNLDDGCVVYEPHDPVAPMRPGPGIHVNGFYEFASGDFNGDGRDDILWYAPGGGHDSIWLGTAGGTFQAGPSINVYGNYQPIVGDFNGDGYADILWYAPGTAADHLWPGGATGFGPSESVTINGDYDPVTGDFNGDGIADILWYAPGPGHDSIWLGGAGGFTNGPAINVNGVYEPIVGDFNGDGKSDILWYAPGVGNDYLWPGGSNGFGATQAFYINGFYEPVVGDFNGDGYTDLLWYAPGPDHDFLWFGSASGLTGGIPLVVNGYYAAIAGDFNGDHKGDIVWYAPGSSPDSLWLGS
jgi:hypothetical protein